MVICTENNQIKRIINDLNDCKTISCSINWKKEQKEINSETGACIESFEDNNEKSYELKATILEHLSESMEIVLKEAYGIITPEISTNILTTYIKNYINYSEINNVIKSSM